MKNLINIENSDKKCFLRHLNPLKIHHERITKADKNMVNDLDYEVIELPVSKKDFNKIEKKNNICINVFCYENNLVYLVYLLNKKFENCMDLLMITHINRSHYVHVKGFNRFMCNRTKIKIKNSFPSFVYSGERVKVF